LGSIFINNLRFADPDDYDFKSTRRIANLDVDEDLESAPTATVQRQEMDATGNAHKLPTPIDIPQAEEKSRREPKGHHEKDPSEIDKTRVETITSGSASDDPAASDVEKDGLPAGMDVLQAAFKKAAWYSLSLTAIVAVVGTFSSFDVVPLRRHSEKINTNANE
jgi:hypothetical protein